MFERFRAEFAQVREVTPSVGSASRDARLAGVAGYEEFVGEFGGASIRDGLYRVHDDQTGPRALALVADAFPEFAAQTIPFGYDWLGRQFAVDFGRVDAGQPQVLLLEPGTGEALEIPLPLAAFHDDELVEYADAALAAGFFGDWSAGHGDALPLQRNECVGYRVPLFLGGGDTVDNLELSDLDVYWSICGQLRRGILSLPPGTSVNQVARDG